MSVFPSTGGPLAGAHRGASGDAPENTRAAFDLAVFQGADLIECDVHRTADGRLVVHHDFDLARTAGLAVQIRDLDLAALRQLDLGAWRGPAFAGQRILTLEEMLVNYGNRVLLNVEIKVRAEAYEALEQDVADAVAREGMAERVVISTFDLETFLRLRRDYPALQASLLFELPAAGGSPHGLAAEECLQAAIAVAAQQGAAGLHLDHSLITPCLMERARRLGLGILAWTVDDPREMRRLAALGVDAVLSNYPERLLAELATVRRGQA